MHFQPYSCQRFEFVLLVLAFTGNLLVDSQLKLLGNCLYITAAKWAECCISNFFNFFFLSGQFSRPFSARLFTEDAGEEVTDLTTVSHLLCWCMEEAHTVRRFRSEWMPWETLAYLGLERSLKIPPTQNPNRRLCMHEYIWARVILYDDDYDSFNTTCRTGKYSSEKIDTRCSPR